MYTDEKIVKPKRKFFPEDINLNSFETVKGIFEKLLDEEINSTEELLEFIKKVSEFNNILSEEMAWKYINMTRFADKEEYSKDFNTFYANVVSPSNKYDFEINKKIYNNKYFKNLPEDFELMKKIIANEIEMFREENIPLQIKENELTTKYAEIMSKLTVEFDGKEMTLIQLGKYLKDPDRNIREKAWRVGAEKINEKAKELNNLFDELKKIRIKIAKNAGFDNYRDYMHKAKGRFDYTPEDLIEFHNSVEKVVLPVLKDLNNKKAKKLNVEKLRPWDTTVDPDGKILKPFETTEEFINSAIKILHNVKPEFGENLNKMKNSGFLDLENRKGKAPGGYNYPLSETGAPFIFMNAIGMQGDVRTLLHESGHAMHSFSMNWIPYSYYHQTPSEVAELASMSMELLTLDYLNEYYTDKEDIKKAVLEQFERSLDVLPWVMTVDAFQHWIYLNPDHTADERTNYFKDLMDRFNTDIDWTNLDEEKGNRWLRQLHIFEVPFYYIEYAMSQLGALAIYKNFKENGKKAVEQYEAFLKLGYTKPVSELYRAAGIKFDFSEKYIGELMEFMKKEIEKAESL
ncbi:oligoendopeptidase F [Tepiditoga spiralis]|uniref:Oligoendopeptidase F n=1 Tax=Tepiditoga spiralis TaxID=2108365 RepID=A0A7G1G5P9_9BACT|nr:M3 family oligoendopeptidase [Tepiditoga spiralis]BBE31445.1 oligoendopeptidase F [Tepiditoga spiralis]